mmetsp:Transcript_81397/g.141282  ORF Transcript_81397/g.141282 Transcript_81397/m.141282 type:complete len:515 (+) Transcript_81397:70-1614(+)
MTDIVEVKQNEDEGALQVLEIISENSLGCFDGQRFYLQRFPVWQQTRKSSMGRLDSFPEQGEENGVSFWQSMGAMYLQYFVDESTTEADIQVDLSAWQMKVSKSGSNIKALSGDLHKDIRMKLSSWQLVEDPMGGKILSITLVKKAHKGWQSIWFNDIFNPHNKKVFAWREGMDTKGMPAAEDEKMQKKGPGTQDVMKELLMTQDTSRICTGLLETEEDEFTINLHVWLDEEALENAATRLPIEEIFAADVEENYMEVYMRADGFGICWGQLTGGVVPDMTSWEILKSVRREVPKGSGIRCPAYYSPCLLIKLVKNAQSAGRWGKVFQDVQHSDFNPPKERISWTERVQRAMILTPSNFFDASYKAERAQQICTKVESSQDDRFAYLSFFLEGRLEKAANMFQVDLSGFFTLNVGVEFLEVKVLADMEYHMTLGKLSGACMPEMASWEIGNKGGDVVLTVSIMKAPGFKGEWEEPIFEKMELAQLTQLFLDNAAAEEMDAAVAASQEGGGEGIE